MALDLEPLQLTAFNRRDIECSGCRLLCCTLFLDLSKVFDTVNHSILLSKLDLYGIRDIENLWFKSYLSRRRQKVYANSVFSDFLDINSGVPQGSILGPLLFLIYMNDVVKVTNYFPIRLFVDDTS